MASDSAKHALDLARALQEASREARALRPSPSLGAAVWLFDQLVTDEELRSACRQLFVDRHYAQSVEEAYKFLNNLVKGRSGLNSEDGAGLMEKAFSPKAPRLKLSKDLASLSANNQQLGYMHVFKGCMIGVRNPRAHTHGHPDDVKNALELLTFCNHLVRVARRAVRARRPRT